jgi:uncharacterized protein DUF4365
MLSERLPLNMAKQQFSFAYVKAVCAAAGLSCVEPYDSFSRDLKASSTGAAELDIQVKCTEQLTEHNGSYAYPLRASDYNNLCAARAIPAILIVVHVPADVASWLSQSASELALRRCGYWLSVSGAAPSTNTAAVTVYLPKDQVFSVESPWDIFRAWGFKCPP